jgi:hypothetical protein
MMEDAIAHARARGHALLLLDGAASFYGRFGYTDVFDANVIGIEAAAVPATPPVGYRVRPATPDDAPATLDLYYRHYGRYLGSFHWTLEHERWRLWLPFVTGNPPVVVENVEGVIAGFLHQWADTNNASEAAADSPSALLALLQHHATWAAAPPGRPPALWWRLPPDSATAYLLADCLAPAEGSHECPSLRLRSRQQRNEGWQARPADMHALLRDVQPLLTERWQSSSRPFQGEFSVQIGEKSSIWTVHDDGIRIGIDSGRSIHQVVLTAQAFTQLVFAFRPVWWLAQQDGVRILPELMSVLHVLFPPGGFNIAGSDAF